jgi:C4-dicarboxylate transporter DctM subunit
MTGSGVTTPTATTAAPGREVPPGRDRGWLREIAPVVVTYAIAVGLVLAMFSGYLTDEAIGVASLVLMLLLVLMQVPVAAAMVLSAFLGMWSAQGSYAAVNLLTDLPFDAVAQWGLTVLPLFIFLGLLLWQSGVTNRLYRAGREWLQWLPGGLAIGTNAAGAGMASISGSTIGSSYALARIGMPEMLKAGYDRRLVVASVMSAGLPGQLIPPSIMMVVYAGIAEVPIGPQLMAGIGPGVLVLVLYCLGILLLGIVRPDTVGRHREAEVLESSNWRTRFASLRDIWLVPAIMAVVVGGIFTGVFTANESAAVGAAIALIAALVYRRKDRPMAAVKTAVTGTVEGVGAVFLVIVGAYAISDMLAVTGLGSAFTEWVTGLGLGTVSFLLVLFVGYLVLGTFIEPLPMMLMTVPLLMPALAEMGVSLLWFGVFVVLMGELAILSPPVGILLYVIANLTKEPEVNAGVPISMRDCLVAQLWLLPVAFFVVLVLILVPEVATAIPTWTDG